MARMGNNAAAAAFAAEQERIQAEQLAAQLRNPAVAGPTSASVTMTPEEVAAWEQQRYSIDPFMGGGLGRALDPISKSFDTLAKLPGSPEAALKGLEAGITGEASWNPFDENAAVSDIAAGGTQLSQNEDYRNAGRAIGTAIGGGFVAPVISGALGGGALGGAGAGAIVSGVPAAMQPGATWESVLKAAAIGGAVGGIKGYMSTDGTIKQLPKDLGAPLPTDFADIAYDPASAPITDFPGMSPEVPGVPSSPLGNFNPGGSFMGPPEYGPPGTPDAPTELPGAPPASQTIDVTGKLPTGGTGGFSPLPPMYTGSPGPIPEGPQPVEPIELAPEKPLPDMPKPAPNYGKLISSLLGNFLSTGGGSSGGGSRGYDQDKLARSLRQPSEPVTMTNPNYIPR